MNNEEKIEHELFDISILLKSAHALIEIIGGLLAYFVNSDLILRISVKMTQGELLEDPNDFLTKHALDLVQNFSVGSKQFVAFYLFSHGVINLALVVGLFMKKIWAYHASFVVFSLFAVYQIYRFVYHPSIFMIVFTVLDFVTIWLVWREYARIKTNKVS